jgi:hypothetical protein
MSLHAAREHGDAAARLAAGREVLRHRGLLGNVIEQSVHGGQAREAREHPGAPDEALKTPALIASSQAEQRSQAIRVREDGEQQAGEPAAPPGPPVALDVGARRLQQRAKAHAGRTCRLAGAAAETEIEVIRELLGDRQAPLGHRAHQVEAAARRVHLLAEDPVGRALG